MKDFDFDLKFRVTGFTIAATYKGNFVEKKTRGAKLTDEMKELIKDLQSDQQYLSQISLQRDPMVSPDSLVLCQLK